MSQRRSEGSLWLHGALTMYGAIASIAKHAIATVPGWMMVFGLVVGGSGEAAGSEIQGVLAGRCLECHSGAEPQGGLDLSSRSGLARGADTGSVFDDASRFESRLWQVIESGEMPPKGKLTEEEKMLFKVWVEHGAALPDEPIDRFRVTSKYRAGYDWWALQPLQSAPEASSPSDPWIRNDIDGYVLSKLRAHGMEPNPPASPRSLLRRVFIDLTGLPPSYADVAAFEADPSEAHYAEVVERLLASPAYGERWARHWLDVVRYGESDGFERNYPRHHSWRYRDWVVDAFNRDMPYETFVRMQIAGDAIAPGLEGWSASSFLVSGVHNTVVGSSDRMKRIAKQDELEEKIGTLSQAFLGLTAQCARCHEHKYDPITSVSYYQLAAAITGVDHGDREAIDPAWQQQHDALVQSRRELVDRLAELDRKALEVFASHGPSNAGPIPVVAWDFSGESPARWNDGVRDTKGELHGPTGQETKGLVLDGATYFASESIAVPLGDKTLAAWVTVDPLDQSGGGVLSVQTPDGAVFDAIVYGERDAGQWMAGSNGFTRSRSFAGPKETALGEPVHIAIRYSADGTIRLYRNGEPYGEPYRTGVQAFAGGAYQVLVGLRHSPPGGNRFFRGIVHRVAVFGEALRDEDIARLAQNPDLRWGLKLAWESMDAFDRERRQELRNAIAALDRDAEALRGQAKPKVYTVISNPQPGPTHVLVRGDVYQLGAPVRPGGIVGLGPGDRDFGLPDTASDSERRMALADWIVRANQPLLARVMVNRIWHYHFGTGIVDTPNDFGFNGGRPSHPELLDALAQRFLDGGMRIKDLHRQIVLSSTYRMSTQPRADAMHADAQNRWLWRYPVRRLDGESARDSMLEIAGVLRPERGGPGFVDVVFQELNGTTYYIPKPEDSSENYRRTIYRFNPRCERSPLLDVLDCPDPSATAPRRANTTTPLQALSLLNNAFVFQMSEALVNRLIHEDPEAGRDPDRLVRALFESVLLRSPDEEELRRAAALIARHGPLALARALWNTNEFLVLE